MMRAVRWGVGISAVAWAAAACGDDDYEGTAPTDVADASSSGSADAAPAPLEISVVSSATSLAPLEGALVALGYTDGTYEVAQSDAAGKARFVSASLAGGIASITGGKEGSLVNTLVVSANAAKDPPGRVLVPTSVAANDTVKLSGAITGKPQTNDTVWLSTTGNGAMYADEKATYSLDVQRDAPILMLGQVLRVVSDPTLSARGSALVSPLMFHLALPAAGIAVEHDLDVSTLTADPVHLVHTHLIVPGGDQGPLGGPTSIADVTLNNLAAPFSAFVYQGELGVAVRTDLKADGTAWDVDLQYADVPGVTPYGLATLALASGAASYVNVTGIPADGAVFDDFLTPVPLASDKLTPGDPIELPASSVNERGAQVVVYAKEGIVWSVRYPGPGSFTLPVLPPELAALARGTGRRQAIISVCQGTTEARTCARQSQTAYVRYVP